MYYISQNTKYLMTMLNCFKCLGEFLPEEAKRKDLLFLSLFEAVFLCVTALATL